MKIIIQASHLVKTFQSGDSIIRAIDDVSFQIKEGELVIILGPSGAGKSTLLNLIGGMDFVSQGSLVVDGVYVGKFSQKQLTEYRRTKVGFVFQFYNLMPNLTAKENIELSTELQRDSLNPEAVLKAVGLENRMDNFPSQLSGGEQQRVSIARALAKNPKFILCDEPTGALDYQTGKEILSLLYTASKKEHKTVVIVTHNSALKDMGDHVLKIKNGKINEDYYNPNPKNIKEIEW